MYIFNFICTDYSLSINMKIKLGIIIYVHFTHYAAFIINVILLNIWSFFVYIVFYNIVIINYYVSTYYVYIYRHIFMRTCIAP